jgi:hypothetical protein
MYKVIMKKKKPTTWGYLGGGLISLKRDVNLEVLDSIYHNIYS